jgi:hypothetical protein
LGQQQVLSPPSHQILRDAPGFSYEEVSRCLRSRQSIWCSPQGWDTPGLSHGEEVTLALLRDEGYDIDEGAG